MGHDARVTLKRVCILSRGGDSERSEIAAYRSALTDTTHGCGRPHDTFSNAHDDLIRLERATRFERATTCLEGRSSAN
jgi:hypothetical protein